MHDASRLFTVATQIGQIKRVCSVIAKIFPKYARYQPAPTRAKGRGAFADFADSVALRGEPKLKSSSLRRPPPQRTVRFEPPEESGDE